MERRKGQAVKEAPVGRKNRPRKSAAAVVTEVKEEEVITLDDLGIVYQSWVPGREINRLLSRWKRLSLRSNFSVSINPQP